MRAPKLEYSVTFEFILTDEQRVMVERALQHDDIVEVRWIPYLERLQIDIVVVELRLGLNRLASAEALAFAVDTLEHLEGFTLQQPVPA